MSEAHDRLRKAAEFVRAMWGAPPESEFADDIEAALTEMDQTALKLISFQRALEAADKIVALDQGDPLHGTGDLYRDYYKARAEALNDE